MFSLSFPHQKKNTKLMFLKKKTLKKILVMICSSLLQKESQTKYDVVCVAGGVSFCVSSCCECVFPSPPSGVDVLVPVCILPRVNASPSVDVRCWYHQYIVHQFSCVLCVVGLLLSSICLISLSYSSDNLIYAFCLSSLLLLSIVLNECFQSFSCYNVILSHCFAFVLIQ